MNAIAVDELQRAWAAVERGEFRATGQRRTTNAWSPTTPVVVVTGAAAGVGASTIALAIAESARTPTRLVDASPAHTTGLAAAATGELGTDGVWRLGDRGAIRLERLTSSPAEPGATPTPLTDDQRPVVLDLGWDLRQAKAAGGWLADSLRCLPLIVVTTATVPGIRRADAALGAADAAQLVVIGPPPRKWDRAVRAESVGRVVSLLDVDRLIAVPPENSVAVRGITTDPLPESITTAVQPLCAALTKERGSP